VTVGLGYDFFAEGEARGGALGSLAKGVAFLRAVDAAQADTCGLLVAQNFERVAVEEGDHSGGHAGGQQWRAMVPISSTLLRSVGSFIFASCVRRHRMDVPGLIRGPYQRAEKEE